MDSVAHDPNEGSSLLRENVYLLLKAIVRSSYLGETLPEAGRLVQMSRLPGSAMQEGLKRLVEEGLIQKEENGYRRIRGRAAKGSVAFLLNPNLFTGWYAIFQDYLIGFEQRLHDAGYEVIFRGDFTSVESKVAAVQEFRQAGIAGVAFASYTEQRLRNVVLEHNIPSVIVGNATINQQDLGCVCSDNFGGAEAIVQFLVEQNHRQIAFYATGLQAHHGFQKRLGAYEQTMRAAGLQPIRELAFSARHDVLCARKACSAFLALNPRPSAVVCSADREAFELMAELQKSGLSIPDDVSITGFDNSVFGAITEPALTTVEIHTREMGRAAANYLLGEMEQAHMPVRIVLPTRLIKRESVKSLVGPGNPPKVSKKTDRIPLPEDEQVLTYGD